MTYPDFFDDVPSIVLYDPLADLLGAAKHGIMTYTYLDAVKLAGHSCPTVAGAYLMALKGIEALFIDEIPERGKVDITFHGLRDEGVNGVIANVLGLISGAAGEEGFKGLKGLHRRSGLLHFHRSLPAPVVMRRTDSDQQVAIGYDPSCVPTEPIVPAIMGKIVNQTASDEERRVFATLWQKNVRMILEHRDAPGLITVSHL